MKMIIRLLMLAIFVAGSMSAIANANSTAGRAVSNEFSNDNKDKKRGRRGDDSISTNSNSNSNSDDNSSRSAGDLSIEQARNIALQVVQGKIVEEESENKHGRTVYEFYIRKDNGDVFEVKVDAVSGKVVKIEKDDD